MNPPYDILSVSSPASQSIDEAQPADDQQTVPNLSLRHALVRKCSKPLRSLISRTNPANANHENVHPQRAAQASLILRSGNAAVGQSPVNEIILPSGKSYNEPDHPSIAHRLSSALTRSQVFAF